MDVLTCANCSTSIDVSGYPPGASVACPGCGATQVRDHVYDQFVVLQRLGQDGISQRFLCRDSRSGREAELRVFGDAVSGQEELAGEIDRRAKVLAAISHPNLCRVFSVGRARGVLYIASEVISSPSIRDLIQQQRKVQESVMLDYGIQGAEALQALWKKGLVHGGISPEVIRCVDRHNTKLTGFETAELHAAGMLPDFGDVLEKYGAPERAKGELMSMWSDVYALGATLFHALSGRLPHSKRSILPMKQKGGTRPAPAGLETVASRVANETAYVVNRMLNQDPGGRYDDFQEVINHLRLARSKCAESVMPPPTSVGVPTKTPTARIAKKLPRRVPAKRSSGVGMSPGRMRSLALIAVGVSLVLTGGILIANSGKSGEDPRREASATFTDQASAKAAGEPPQETAAKEKPGEGGIASKAASTSSKWSSGNRKPSRALASEQIAGAKVIGSSGHDGDNFPDRLVNGISKPSADDRWSADGFPQWAEIDLGREYLIERIVVYPHKRRAYQYHIDAKPEGGQYTTVAKRAATGKSSAITHTLEPLRARYVKITVTGVAHFDGTWVSLTEVKFFGRPAP